MVAQKKGRGAKTQAAKPKPAEDVVEEAEVPEQAEENNGVSDQVEHGDDGIAAEGAENADESTEGDQNQENPDGETKTEEKQEEKVETGKLLVENLPSSYLFDYQEKLKELFSKHGEINTVK